MLVFLEGNLNPPLTQIFFHSLISYCQANFIARHVLHSQASSLIIHFY